jgi:hypothetical protein
MPNTARLGHSIFNSQRQPSTTCHQRDLPALPQRFHISSCESALRIEFPSLEIPHHRKMQLCPLSEGCLYPPFATQRRH